MMIKLLINRLSNLHTYNYIRTHLHLKLIINNNNNFKIKLKLTHKISQNISCLKHQIANEFFFFFKQFVYPK